MDWLFDLIGNPFFVTGFTSWLIAQVLKTIIYAAINKKLDMHRLVGDGGMPSGHSATVTSIATMSALTYGLGGFEFAISCVFAIIVCHDAMGVRRETGKQATVLKEIMELVETLSKKDLPEAQLKELVGHTPIQVLAGILLGILNALFMYYVIF